MLTTCEITTTGQAQECLRWYCLRWRVEDWHRVLKSVCRIKALQHKTAERLKRAIAINLLIAWRIMRMTLLGRAWTPFLAGSWTTGVARKGLSDRPRAHRFFAV